VPEVSDDDVARSALVLGRDLVFGARSLER
jgi:hypothetical protein